MDVVYPILIGAGMISMLLAFIIKKKQPVDSFSSLPTQRTTDKDELEKSVQRLQKQVKQETNLLAAEWQEMRADLLEDIASLRKRLDYMEEQWQTSESHNKQEAPKDTHRIEPAPQVQEVDMLALRERYRRAFELSKEGLSRDEIAKRLGAGRGEIDLIFSLADRHERGLADA
ncbi:RNA polymerase subunit sigma-70 [Brevibacillus sp. M2.1A]|nr:MULTISPECIES: RNA polymerase subunit sigma-70 [Brevibacillus]MCC8436883.1 RNA polymerase subunit sigma-70 [Brevibacillus sp. M2.1A]MCM3141432.1 RNA polymerase subunit sigma-70 [Brevibacillus sp. MER 51]